MLQNPGNTSSGSALKALVSNASILFSGGMLVSIMAVISFILVARQLGPDVFGIFALCTSAVLVIDRLVNFQSWQAIVRFGSELVDENSKKYVGLPRLVAGCFLFDVMTALIGAGVACLSIYLLGFWMEWSADTRFAGAIFGLVVGSKISGSAIGIFRLLEDYWGQVYVQVAASTVKLALVLVGVYLDWGILGFLAVWAATEILMQFGLTLMAFFKFRARYNLQIFSEGVGLEAEVIRFMVWTNVAVAADLPAKEFDVVIVGLLAGERAAGVYKIARQGMALVGKVSSPMYQAVYPVQSKMLAKRDRAGAVRITLRSSMLLAAVSAVLVLVSWPLLPSLVPLVLGSDYGAVWALFLFAVVVKSLDNIFTPVHSLFIALGYIKANLLILLVANGLLLVGFWLVVPTSGAIGALACLAAQAIFVLCSKIYVINKRAV